jgi:hypothetical protein
MSTNPPLLNPLFQIPNGLLLLPLLNRVRQELVESMPARCQAVIDANGMHIPY